MKMKEYYYLEQPTEIIEDSLDEVLNLMNEYGDEMTMVSMEVNRLQTKIDLAIKKLTSMKRTVNNS